MRNLRGSARMRGFHSRVNEKKNFERVDSLSLCLSLSYFPNVPYVPNVSF